MFHFENFFHSSDFIKYFLLFQPEKMEKIIVEDYGVRKPANDRLKIIKLYQQVAQEAVKSVPPGVPENVAKKTIADFIYNAFPDEIVSNRKFWNFC